MDHLAKEKRSWNMSRIRSVDSTPELILRKLLHREGYRDRLHQADLPGKPDLVLKKFNTVIFLHGCFWHLHKNCKRATVPKTNKKYWNKKLDKNKKRDSKRKTIELHV